LARTQQAMNSIKNKKYNSIATLTAIASLSIPNFALPVIAKNSSKSYSQVSTHHARCLQTYNGKEIDGHKVQIKGGDRGNINITKRIIIPITIELSYAYDFTKNTLNVNIINSPIAYDKVWQEANKIVDECR